MTNNTKNKIIIEVLNLFFGCENHICQNTQSFEGYRKSGTNENNHINDLNIGKKDNFYSFCSKCIYRNYNSGCKSEVDKQQNQLIKFFDSNRSIGRLQFTDDESLKKNYLNLYYCTNCANDPSKIDSKALRPYYPKDEILLPETQFFNDDPVPFNKYERRFILHTLNRMNDFMNNQEGYF